MLVTDAEIKKQRQLLGKIHDLHIKISKSFSYATQEDLRKTEKEYEEYTLLLWQKHENKI